MKHHVRAAWINAAIVAVCSGANAQSIDQFDVRREGNNAVLQLRFASEVQFQRSVTTRSGDLTLIFYSLVTTTNDELRASRGLRLGQAQGLPEVTIADEAERGEKARRLVVRSAQSVRINARAGQGNRSIEIVFEGLGAGVVQAQPAPRPALRPAAGAAVPAAAAPPAALVVPEGERRFVVVLQSSTDPNLSLTSLIPRSLQAFEVFTGQRVVDGVTRYEVSLGYFANRVQAEAALRQLSAFPQAAVIAHGAPAPVPSAPPAAAVAVAPTAPPVPPVPAIPPAPPLPSPPMAAAPPAATPGPEAAPLAPAEIEAKAAALYAAAQAAMGQNSFAAALESLNELLNLPPNRQTRDAQEMAGIARARSGDVARARVEFETYLQLFPQGPGSDRVRRELAALPAPAPQVAEAPKPRPEVETTVTGSTSMYFYGGNGQVRSQDFKDSPIAGLPQVAGDPLLTADKSSQLFNDVDLNWRRRDAERDMRFVFRDSYSTDLERSDKSRNRLSALYFDYKSIPGGFSARLGRQSPIGGGVMGRFDGVTGSYLLRPKLKLGAVAGEPTDRFFDSKRRFYGVSLDADQVLPNFGAGVYAIQQTIDSEIDRRAVGLEMRYFKGGASVFSQFDYDTLIKGLNIATVQGTLIMDDGTVLNALYDRRALQMLALGNSLTFEDPAAPGQLFTRIQDKLAGPPPLTLAVLRDQIKRITPYITQGQLGITRPLNKSWQAGASVQLTNTGAIPPVPEVVGFETGRPATGNIYSVSAQLIGLNLYSARDTHVLSSSVISSPTLKGYLASYNNSSIVSEAWQVEPSLQYYRDRNPEGSTNARWTPGLRITYRGLQHWAIESNVTYEIGKASRVTSGPDPTDPTLTVTTTTKESTNRANYSLGARYEF